MQELLVRMVELVEGDGVSVEQGDQNGEGVVVEQGDEGEMRVLDGQEDDEVGVVGLGKGKVDTPVWGQFVWSEGPSGVVGGVSRIHSAGWSGSWGLPSENP